jgi:cytochrome P450
MLRVTCKRKEHDSSVCCCNTNILGRFAGSDTTAIALRSIFYHLCKCPRVYQAAVQELDSATELSSPITFEQGQHLPYIQACIKEGLRLQPAVGMLLERIVPKGGATLDGIFFPAGTIVGINPWVVAIDKSVYGQNAQEFRPERWLEASAEDHRLMERNFLAVSTNYLQFPFGIDL